MFNPRKAAVFYTHTHTHTHTGKFCLAFFSIIFAFMTQTFASGIPATNGVAQPATCDTDTLETSTGPAQLRAQFTPEVINLKWYDGNERINVPSASNTCTYDTAISLPTNPTRPGYKFKGWKVITDYTPIEYLQNTGTGFQYIDTGVPGDNNNYRFITDFMLLNLPDASHSAIVFTSDYTGASGQNTWRLLVYRGQKFLFYTNTHTTYPRPSYDNSPNPQTNQRYLIDMNYNRIIVNGTTYTPNGLVLGSTNNTNIKLFPISDFPMVTRVYSFKIYDSGTLIRDMVPVKDLSGVACMYDKVSGQFFYNAGTGNFVAGPEI